MRRALLILIPVVLAGCATVDSADLRTSGISAHITVVAGSEGTGVHVNLSAGGNTSVELHGDDEITARSGEDETGTSRSSFLGLKTYSGQLDVSKPGATVVVSFVRGDADESAPDSSVRLPERVGVTAPRDQAKVRRAKDLVVRVADAPGAIRVGWAGECVVADQEEFAEGAPVVVPAGSLVRPDQAPARCLVTLTVTRLLPGTLDSAFKGGGIRAERSESVAVRLRP